MLEQPLPMSSALRARAGSLGFLMGYNNNNTQDNVYSAAIMAKSFREFTQFI